MATAHDLVSPRRLAREGAALLGASVILYEQLGGGWLWFALLLLAPDLAALGYLAGAASARRPTTWPTRSRSRWRWPCSPSANRVGTAMVRRCRWP